MMHTVTADSTTIDDELDEIWSEQSSHENRAPADPTAGEQAELDDSSTMAPASLIPIVMGLVATLYTFNLGTRPYWFDEVLQIAVIDKPLVNQIGQLSNWGFNGLAHVMMQDGLMQLFGDDEAIVRLPSVVAMAGVIGIIMALARSVSRHAAWCLIPLAMTSTFLHRFAQEARPYAVYCLLAWASLALFHRRLSRAESVGVDRWFIPITASMAVVHLYAPFVLAVEALALLLLWRVGSPSAFPGRQRLGRALAVVAASWAPFYAASLFFASNGAANWYQRPSLRTPVSLYRTYGGGMVILGLGGLLLAGAVVREIRRREWTGRLATGDAHATLTLLVGVVVLVPVPIALAVALLKPVFTARYLVFISPGIVLGLSLLLASVRNERVRYGLLAALTIGGAWNLAQSGHVTGFEEYDRVVEQIAFDDRPGDLVVLVGGGYNFHHYDGKLPDGAREASIYEPPIHWARAAAPEQATANMAHLGETLASDAVPRIWVSVRAGWEQKWLSRVDACLTDSAYAEDARYPFADVTLIRYTTTDLEGAQSC